MEPVNNARAEKYLIIIIEGHVYTNPIQIHSPKPIQSNHQNAMIDKRNHQMASDVLIANGILELKLQIPDVNQINVETMQLSKWMEHVRHALVQQYLIRILEKHVLIQPKQILQL